MKTAKIWQIKIKSLQPVLWNRDKREIRLELKTIKKTELEEWEEQNWVKKADFEGKFPSNGEKIDNRKVFMPPEWFKQVLVAACKKTRLVPHFETRKSATYTDYISSTIIDSNNPVCLVKDLEYYGAYVNGQGGRVGGGKVWRIRPKLTEWNHTFKMIDPFGRMSKDELKELLDYAGAFVGIGDNRKNNFGRFEIVSVNEVKS